MYDANVDLASLPRRTQAIIIVAVAAGILFLIGRAEDIYWLRMITKPIPVLAMAFWLTTLPEKGRFQWAVIVGLIFSAAGDILLEASPGTFIFGLVAFLLGHIAYIVAFTQDSRQLFLGRAALAYGYGVAIFAVLYLAGDLGEMTIPVLLYVVVICTMLWRAASRVSAPGVAAKTARVGLWGAILFTFSDSLLAVNMFAFTIPLAGYIVIITYWMAQSDIALSAGWQRQS
ncbi:MAG TPA: lysoplasmalogenase [Anaerolineae bacterium]|nr:lysoplasmalogenase [Anaerolineae bacterium]